MKKINAKRNIRKGYRHTRFLNRIKREGNEKPRLIVTKTNANLFAQILDDSSSKVLVAVNSVQLKKQANIEVAKIIGEKIAEKAVSLGISEVIFDRCGSKYHGQIKSIADAAREKGLIF
ncbi:MAG: 50S ribosomal protein L18 [Mycoplasmataceae bacterium]|jgi:large subunit ribosomal protein L18|nr:50S ribosomal protein L18 [Mycoplasmataceae bacterium]